MFAHPDATFVVRGALEGPHDGRTRRPGYVCVARQEDATLTVHVREVRTP